MIRAGFKSGNDGLVRRFAGDGGTFRDLIVLGFNAQVTESVSQRVSIVRLIVFCRTGIGGELEEVAAETRKISAGKLAFPTSSEVVGNRVFAEEEVVSVLARMEVPMNSIEFSPVAGRVFRMDHAGEFVEELSDLPAGGRWVGAKEVEDLSGAICELALEGGDVQAPVHIDDAGLVVARDEHHVEVPRDWGPTAIGRVVVGEVAVRPEVHICQETVHRMETVKCWEIDVFAPPCFGVVLSHPVQERVPVRMVGCGTSGEMFPAALRGVDISIGQLQFLEPISVEVLDGEVEALKISGELIFWVGLRGRGDDAPLDPVRVGGGHSGQLIRTEGEGFVESSDAAMDGEVGG